MKIALLIFALLLGSYFACKDTLSAGEGPSSCQQQQIAARQQLLASATTPITPPQSQPILYVIG